MTRQFLRFALVGVLGFAVDSTVLWVLLVGGADLYLGRAGSFLVAVTFTWATNRIFTFADRSPKPLRQWMCFAVVNCIGGSVNLGVYAWLIWTAPLVAMWPILGVAIGSLAGMLWNFFVSRQIVFHQHQAATDIKPL